MSSLSRAHFADFAASINLWLEEAHQKKPAGLHSGVALRNYIETHDTGWRRIRNALEAHYGRQWSDAEARSAEARRRPFRATATWTGTLELTALPGLANGVERVVLIEELRPDSDEWEMIGRGILPSDDERAQAAGMWRFINDGFVGIEEKLFRIARNTTPFSEDCAPLVKRSIDEAIHLLSDDTFA